MVTWIPQKKRGEGGPFCVWEGGMCQTPTHTSMHDKPGRKSLVNLDSWKLI